jgi:N-acetylneuraminic acid mutarotase
MKKTIPLGSRKAGALVLILALGLVAVCPATEDTWTYKAEMPTARGFTSGCVVDGKIYVIGGFPTHYSVTTAVEMYDPIADTWTRMSNMPSGQCAHATCTYGGKIYVFGGVSPDPYSTAKKNVYEYDPQTNTWTQKADIPYANAYCGIAVVNDTIYLIGGMSKYNAPPVSTVMAYHPLTDSWSEKAPMPTARGMLSACTLDGKIYAIGGNKNVYTSSYKVVEVYDPATNTWTTKTDMPTARAALGVCVVSGNIYAIGGYNYPVMCTSNEMYDPVSDTWISKSPMQETRLMFFLGSVDDKIYAIGGSYPNPQNSSEPVVLSSVEEYDTTSEPTSVEGVSEATAVPSEYALSQNYPNPFNPQTTIRYDLPFAGTVRLSVYNVVGQMVRTLVNGQRISGTHSVMWDGKDCSGRDMARGLYLYRLEVEGQYVQTRRMVLLR